MQRASKMADGDGVQNNSINYKSICCEKIPELFLDKLVAKNHFGKFGRINRFILRPKRLSCTVEYETEDDAERALMEAGDYNGHAFDISYAEREVAHVQNTEEWVDPDVQSELEAMGAGARITAATPRQSKFLADRPLRAVPGYAPPKQPKPPAEPQPKVDASLRNELEALLRKPAYSFEEKYRVLDARDKLIRLTTVRQTDIKKAVSTKGTCPDMCPEKERLMREFQRQVSSFEIANGDDDDGADADGATSISHRRAIKEYSRSSADQEVPLAHELRAESVLHMTMLYLMHNIMDLCDDPQTSLGDWFHFVWDRTRSIRKDITQQELCSLGAVQLVEQCARFHIHCGARLVAEDPSVFDKKINVENLTKCLQSLKYMYHDLRIKNIPCPCEAEFRSYIILLNLGDANFLWELKQLPEHIQNSSQIKRAIAFYNALQNNNYVRFFSMIRAEETSYLSACILLGYFNRLRLRAMEAIIKAHLWRKNDVLPLAYLARVLGFEHAEMAANFFSYHGLQCDGERVYLDRLKKPDVEYSMNRALELVESKRTVTVGECVCGHPLESPAVFRDHQPHNSFDGNGLLKADAWAAEDQLRGDTAAAKLAERRQQNKAPSNPPPQAPRTDNDAGLFKVPRASPPLPLRQNPSKLTPQSIFGGFAAKPSGVQEAVAGGSMSAAPPTAPPKGLFAAIEPAVTKAAVNAASIFKVPDTTASNSLFKPHAPRGPSAFGDSIFGGIPPAQTTAAAPTPAPVGGGIFGAAAKVTANIFNLPPKQALPMAHDNIFQNFRTTTTMPTMDTSAAEHGQQTNSAALPGPTPPAVAPSVNRESQQQRVRELVEEHERKQRQLLEERQKLRQVEERQKQMQLQAAAERKRRAELEQLAARAEELTACTLDTLLKNEMQLVAQTELAKYQRLERQSQQALQQLLLEAVRSQVEALAGEEYASMCHDQLLLDRYFARWLLYARKKAQQRKLMQATPIWVTTDTRSQQIAKLVHPRQQENLQLIRRYRHGEPCNFSLLLWESPLCQLQQEQLDLFEQVGRHTQRRPTARGSLLSARRYLKLLFTLPGDMEELHGFESLCNRWLAKYVKAPANADADADADAVRPFVCGVERNVALCVRKVSGVTPRNEAGAEMGGGECNNAGGIVCFLSGGNLQNSRKRLHHLLKLSRTRSAGVPVSFVVYDCKYEESQLAELLEMDQLLDEGRVSAYRFYGCLETKSHFSFGRQLAKALRFVARESSVGDAEAAALEMQTLTSWLSANLGEEMWQRWEESALKNPAFSKVCSMPQHVVALYHEALRRLQSIVAEDMEDSPEFPQELKQFVSPVAHDVPLGLEHFPADWKSTQRRHNLSALLEKLRLPVLDGSVDAIPTELEDYEIWLLNYAGRIIPDDDTKATEASYHAIKALIDQLNRSDLQDLEVGARLRLVNFLPIVKALVFAHANKVLAQFRKASGGTVLVPGEVIYRRQAISDYQTLPWWLNCATVQAVTVDYTLEQAGGAHTTAGFAREAACTHEDISKVIQRAEEISRRAENNLLALRNSSFSSKLTADVDKSLHDFELAKESGQFDYSFVDEMADDLDGTYSELEGAVGGCEATSPASRKRKHKESFSEMEAIMERAFNLIETIESREDLQNCRRRKMSALSEFP